MEKVTSLKVIAPFYMHVLINKKQKKVPINLNWYRNAHYRESSKVKKEFAFAVCDQLIGVEIETPVEVTYKVFKPINNRLDKMNVASIASKFLLDALSEFGVWDDDNDDNVKTETILPTELDRENPRIEVCFKTIS